jgi:hypothetical protein
MKKFLTCIIFLFCSSAFAENISCTPAVVKVENKNIILPGITQPKTTKVYFFNNVSKQSLWLDHPVEKRSASAGWSSYLRPSNWSAIVLNRKNFAISCAVIKPGSVDYQDCSKAITICSPQHYTLNTKQKGTFWLVEDRTWDEFLKKMEKHKVEK